MDWSRFLMNTFPTPERLMAGSRCDHMILMGLPTSRSKLSVSRARSASDGWLSKKYDFILKKSND
ncbi:hypothetical protein BpHYR1_025753 [Brachionus plicatilis]|uniref:Uncharacterized protein n=1 Tax=Brachionus plicatilis TaxID=10195 RepID=A0A3M7RNM4_BRAPC|nr:hypothetical protein BpHYR1_025753 [Brachionus plicatilis]